MSDTVTIIVEGMTQEIVVPGDEDVLDLEIELEGQAIVASVVDGELVPTIVLAGPPGPAGATGDAVLGTAAYENVEEFEPAGSVINHELDTEPHPAYDDMPDLRLTFENALV